MTPPPSPFQDITIISCPNCNANYAATQPICPRCKGRVGGNAGRADGAKKGAGEGDDESKVKLPTFEATEGPERDLQQEVEDWLKERCWYYWHDRSRKKNSPGFLDLVIAAPGKNGEPGTGITLWCELKRKGEQPTSDQKKTIQQLSALGHYVRVVRSLEEFKAWIGGLLARKEMP